MNECAGIMELIEAQGNVLRDESPFPSQERRDLAFTLKDTKTIVGKLRMIVGVALHLIFIMFYLVIFAVCPTSAGTSVC